jgi:hypothetical protein
MRTRKKLQHSSLKICIKFECENSNIIKNPRGYTIRRRNVPEKQQIEKDPGAQDETTFRYNFVDYAS